MPLHLAFCLALANSSFLASWRMGGGGTPFLEMPSGRLVMMANFGPATSISHLNGRAYWGWGEPSRYRCHLGRILLKMPAISLLTGRGSGTTLSRI